MANVHAAVQSPAGAVSNIAATASPQTLTNTGADAVQVIVSGGTVSDVSFSRDAGANYFTTGQTAGAFLLGPGDTLKVTYSANPTMTLVPM